MGQKNSNLQQLTKLYQNRLQKHYKSKNNLRSISGLKLRNI
eukprot:UN10928